MEVPEEDTGRVLEVGIRTAKGQEVVDLVGIVRMEAVEVGILEAGALHIPDVDLGEDTPEEDLDNTTSFRIKLMKIVRFDRKFEPFL